MIKARNVIKLDALNLWLTIHQRKLTRPLADLSRTLLGMLTMIRAGSISHWEALRLSSSKHPSLTLLPSRLKETNLYASQNSPTTTMMSAKVATLWDPLPLDLEASTIERLRSPSQTWTVSDIARTLTRGRKTYLGMSTQNWIAKSCTRISPSTMWCVNMELSTRTYLLSALPRLSLKSPPLVNLCPATEHGSEVMSPTLDLIRHWVVTVAQPSTTMWRSRSKITYATRRM